MPIPSVIAAGLDPRNLPERVSTEAANEIFGGGANGPRRWKDVWSAGHSVSGVNKIRPVAELVDLTAAEYEDARRLTLSDTIA